MATMVQSWSVIVRIESKLLDSGRSTMRSMAMVSKGALFHSVVIGKVGILGFAVRLLVD